MHMMHCSLELYSSSASLGEEDYHYLRKWWQSVLLREVYLSS